MPYNKREEPLGHSTARMGLKIIMLGGANQTQRVYMIPFIENSRKCRLTCRDR